MDITGIQLVTEFNKILEQYAASPFGFRLRKSGRSLKLLEYNGLLYLNLNNLYNIIDELLGPNIPNSIMEYLEQIIFSEEITIETKNGYESCQVTCIQFIDERFFERCNEWVIKKSRKDQKDPNENLFKMLYGNNDLIDSFFEVRNSNLDSMFPFQDFFEQEKLSNSREMDFREYCSDPRLNNQIKGTIRPRGKNMDSLSFDPIARPYACDVPFCNRAFKRNEHLKRHQKMHSGEKPFRCTYLNCKKSFSRSDNLAQHLKTHNTRIENNECLRKISENSFGKY